MKRANSCKHRQAVKNIQCEKKLFKSHLHFSKSVKKVEKHATSINEKMATSMESLFLSACCCKNESEVGFLTVTSSWKYQDDFSAETSQFLSNTTHLYDYAANNLMNF